VTPVGIVGRKDSGKTHLVVRLVAEFRRRGLTVSTIKHTHHHDVEPDAPGKDSFRHREAGAGEVLVASDRRWYLVHEARDDGPPDLAGLVSRLAPCDVVLIEGYKGLTTLPRIEVYRPGATAAAAPLAAGDPGILAIASPGAAAGRGPGQGICLDLDDTGAIAEFILGLRA
jgi:molybdopterin-guanine dinucleotide biosynthesis protein MobB